MANPTPYPDLNTVLHTFTTGVQAALADNLIGVYLQGSFAVGGFDEHSDVDFIVVIKRDLNGAEEAALQQLHGDIYDSLPPWSTHLEGSYVSAARWRRFTKPATPLFYLDNTARTLVYDDHCDTRVVRWSMREHAITLYGPPANTLIDPVDPDALRRDMLATMHLWTRYLNDNPDYITNGWGQPYLVVSFCRMLQTLDTATVESKQAGIEWGLQNLDPKWHDLFNHAWSQRPDPSTKVHTNADPERIPETLAFIEFAISTAKSRLALS